MKQAFYSRCARVWSWLRTRVTHLKPLRVAEEVAVLLIVLQLAVLVANGVRGSSPILGLRLDGQTIGKIGADFGRQVNSTISTHDNAPITFEARNLTSTVTPRQLGGRTEEKRLTATLLHTGRTGNVFRRIAEQDAALVGRKNIAVPSPRLDQTLVGAYIATLDKKIDTPPANAYFQLEGQHVVVHPDAVGVALDANATVAVISRAAAGGVQTTKPVALPNKQTPATVTETMLQPLLPQVQAIAQKPLTIVAGQQSVVVSQQQLVDLVVPKVTPNPKDAAKPTVEVSFDQAKLNAIADNLVKQVVVAPTPTVMSNGKVYRAGTSGLQPQDDHPTTHIMSTLLQRETGHPTPAAQIPLIKVDPPVVPLTAVPNLAKPKTTQKGTGIVYLTFDDGPGAYTEQVLDILKQNHVHATFYVIGRNVQRYPQTMQRIHAEGHAIGNHSFTHSDLSQLSQAAVVKELTDTQVAIQQACGVTPTTFRAPYGAQNQTVRNVAASLGLSDDGWSVDPRDWAQPGSSVITQRVLGGSQSGAVVLLHVLHQQTVDALPAIIQGLRAQGYTLN